MVWGGSESSNRTHYKAPTNTRTNGWTDGRTEPEENCFVWRDWTVFVLFYWFGELFYYANPLIYAWKQFNKISIDRRRQRTDVAQVNFDYFRWDPNAQTLIISLQNVWQNVSTWRINMFCCAKWLRMWLLAIHKNYQHTSKFSNLFGRTEDAGYNLTGIQCQHSHYIRIESLLFTTLMKHFSIWFDWLDFGFFVVVV